MLFFIYYYLVKLLFKKIKKQKKTDTDVYMYKRINFIHLKVLYYHVNSVLTLYIDLMGMAHSIIPPAKQCRLFERAIIAIHGR